MPSIWELKAGELNTHNSNTLWTDNQNKIKFDDYLHFK